MTDDTTPERLLEEARGGGEAALGSLLGQYAAYLKLLARVQIGRRLQGKADASDVVQEAFLEAHRNFPLFRGATEPEFVAWLRRILAGRLALLIRHYFGTKGRDPRLEHDLTAELDGSSVALGRTLRSPGSSPSGAAARREQAVLLADALARLPEHYREVIVLRHLEELPFAEVAERMGRSETAVQKLWLRALAELRHDLGGKP